MGYLIEVATWSAGIPYFEADAILTGGPDCPDNIPIQQLANRTAFLKKQIDDSVSGALTVMYASRLKTARNIAMTGDGSWNVTFDGNGNVTSAMTLAASGVAAGTYRSVTVDVKGRVTGGSNPTTLAGYGITDAQPLDADLTALAALVTTGFYVNTGVGTVAARTLTAGTGISISNGDGVAGNPVITNTGVTSLTGTANQINVSAASGGVTLSLPQAIHSGAKPSFAQVALAADPTNGLDAATKQYVDNMAAGLEVKTSVRAATTANITLSGTQTIDGVALVAGDRVLVKNQTTASQNGLYLVAAGAWTRTTDTDAWTELVSAFVFVESGTSNADSGWVCTIDPGGTLGTNSVSWTQFAGAGTVTAGTGLAVSGNQVALAAGSNVLALHNLASTGMVIRTGAGALVARSMAAGAGLTVSNADGLTGNPTYALAASGVGAGTYPKVTVDTYGRVTAGAALAAADIPPLDWSKLTSGLPTTLAGYGITDAKQIQSIAAAVAGNALTLTLNPTSLEFRANSLSSGTVNTRGVTAALSLTVPSGATLGTVNGQSARLVLLAIDNAGTVELAVANLAGGINLDETTLISTEALSAAADSASTIYSTTARTSVPFRVVGFIDIAETTAGTWAAAPTTIQGCGGQALAAMASLGHGQTWQDVIASRASGITYYNTTGRPIMVSVVETSDGTRSLTVGGVLVSRVGGTSADATLCAVVPPGASYVYSGGIAAWAELR